MFSYWAQPEDTLDLSMMLNDHMADCVRAAPDKFIGLGTLPMQDPELAVLELKRCVNELGLAGVQIGSHINSWNLSDPALRPIFDAAEKLGAAVFVHPWDMIGSDLMKSYFLPWLVGMPAETSLAVCSMLFGGVIASRPDLRVCFAHGAGAFPGTIGRIQHGFDVRPDLCAKDCAVSPTDQLGTFWSDSLVHDPHTLAEAVRVLGADRVCLGSDYPFPLGEFTAESRGIDYCAGALIDSMAEAPFSWSDRQRADMLGRNALEGWLDRRYEDYARMQRPIVKEFGR
jgi:aminocarboxymuconate-semialdehyde decarboxylase